MICLKVIAFETVAQIGAIGHPLSEMNAKRVIAVHGPRGQLHNKQKEMQMSVIHE
jgi:hypothetical protein